MRKPQKVSVCIPCYNGSRYLDVCLASVLAQTYQDLEILAVDDGSTDSTVEMLEDYSARDERIQVYRNDRNLGLVGNWNRCLELAKHEWVKFVFQDDIIHEACIENLIAAAKRPLVFCRRSFVFESGTSEELVSAYKNIPTLSDLFGGRDDVSPKEVQLAILRQPPTVIRNFFGEPTAALMHRSLFDRFGGFNSNLAQICDLEYWIRVAINTGLTYVNEPLATFRVHASSTSASNRKVERDELVSIYDFLVMMHEFAYNPHYAGLRTAAEQVAFRRRFQREFAEKAVWVRARAQAMANRAESPDSSWIEYWDKLVYEYPRFEMSIWHLPFRMKQAWERYLGWRLRG